MSFKLDVLKRLFRIEEKIDELLHRDKPVKGIVLLLDCPSREVAFMAKKNSLKGMVAVPTFTIAELASKGALIQLFDAGDNPAPLPTTPHTHSWASGDTTILTVTIDPANQDQATVVSTGKAGTAKVSCFLHATDTPPSFPDIDAECNVIVAAGPPTQGIVALAP